MSIDLTVTQAFDAPRALLYQTWTDPGHLARWQGAPFGFTVTSHEADLRPGGAYKLCMRGPDGTDHWLAGEYHEVVEPERLVFTHRWLDSDVTTLVTMTFVDRGHRSELTLHQTGFASPASRDGHESGWRSSFDRLAAYLSADRVRSEIELLRYQTRITHDVVRYNVHDLTHEDSLVHPLPDGNRLNWVMGHMVLVDQRMLRRLGQTQVMPEATLARYDRGSRPLEAPSEAVDFRALIDAWNASQAGLDAGLAALTPAAFESRSGFSPSGNPKETVRSLLTTLVFHQAYHAGQTGILRRIAGKQGAIG